MKNLIISILLCSSSVSFGQQTISLVEQFTGFKCEHCPDAMLLMDSLETEFQDSVVFVNIHTGTFANPNSSGTSFLDDLRIAEGEEYYQFCDPVGIPSAMINRRVDGNNPSSVAYVKNNWRNKISEVVTIPKPINIQISYSYDAVTNIFNITTYNEVLMNLNGDYSIVYYIIEDNVITDQVISGGQINANYAQQHVLRDVLNGVWGEILFSGSITAGTVETHSLQYTPSANILNLNECSLIAYVRNELSNEIIQVSKVAIDDLSLELLDNMNEYKGVFYPNPSNDIFEWTNKSFSEPILIKVLDQTGRVVFEQSFISDEQVRLNLNGFDQGTYILQLFNSEKNHIESCQIIKK